MGIHAVPCHETLVATVTYLLAMLSPLRVRVKRLLLDRGFYAVPVIHWLKALNIPFLMPAVIRGKTGGTRALLVGRKSSFTSYTLSSPNHGRVTCRMAIVCGYYKGFKHQHGIRYAIYVLHRVKVSLPQLHDYYRDRSAKALFGWYPFQWRSDWRQSFHALRDNGWLFVAPVLQTLILNRGQSDRFTRGRFCPITGTR